MIWAFSRGGHRGLKTGSLCRVQHCNVIIFLCFYSMPTVHRSPPSHLLPVLVQHLFHTGDLNLTKWLPITPTQILKFWSFSSLKYFKRFLKTTVNGVSYQWVKIASSSNFTCKEMTLASPWAATLFEMLAPALVWPDKSQIAKQQLHHLK